MNPYTLVCTTAEEYSGGLLATSTQSCYRPVDVYLSFFLEFLVAMIFIFAVLACVYLFRVSRGSRALRA